MVVEDFFGAEGASEGEIVGGAGGDGAQAGAGEAQLLARE